MHMRLGLRPGDPTGEAYRAPRPPSWEPIRGRGGEGKGGKEEKGRGSIAPLLFYSLTTAQQ